MVVDTLALVKVDQSATRAFSFAIIGLHGGLDEYLLAFFQRQLRGSPRVGLKCFSCAEELIEASGRTSFDLLFIFLNPGLSHPDNDAEIDPYKLVADLRARLQKPIIIVSNEITYNREKAPLFIKAGADAFFPMPFSLDHLGLALTGCGIRLKPILSVLLLEDGTFDKLWEVMLKHAFGGKYDLRFTRFGRASELLWLVQEQTFDLILMYYMNVDWDVPGCDPFDLLASLKYGKRIFVTQGMDLSEQCERAGITFVESPVSPKAFWKTMEVCLSAQLNRAQNSSKLTPQVRKPGSLRIVMVNDEPAVLQSFDIILRGWFKDATSALYGDGFEAWQELCETDPDLLITDDMMPGMRGSELCQRLLDRKVTYPIIVNSPWEPTEQWVREFAERGLNVFFLALPFDLDGLQKVLEAAGFKPPGDKLGKAVETAAQPRERRPPRIVILDDEEGFQDLYALMLKTWYDGAEILKFGDAGAAWRELSRADPDLFISDLHHTGLSCESMLGDLAERKVNYHILIISAMESYAATVKGWGPGLNVSFLRKPTDSVTFRTVVEDALQITAKR